MAGGSMFSARSTAKVPSSRKTPMQVVNDFRGLDLVNPYDSIQKGRTPFAQDFRMFSEDEQGRRTTISTRKGSGLYSQVFGEAANVANTVTTGAADQQVDLVTNWKAMPFTVSASGRLTKVELNLKKGTGVGPLIIEIYNTVAGLPGEMIASSSVNAGDILETYSYLPAHFIEAPAVTSGQTYWIVAYIQDDGSGHYDWSSNTASTLAMTSNSGPSGFVATTYSLNFKTYIADSLVEKGSFRFNKQGGTNVTLVVYGTTLYSINDGTGAFTVVASGLNTNATEYSWDVADGKVFWVNGYDNLKCWDGTTVETITDTELPILSQIKFNKDRLFGVSAANPNRIVFSEAPGNPSGGGPTTQWYYAWLSVSFIEVPAPKVADPIMALVPFQDVLKIITTNNKYDLYGFSRETYTLKQSTGTKGAVSKSVFADESYIYFVGDDGIYRHNGTSDELISDLVQPIISSIANLDKINITKWKRQVRFYYPGPGSSVNNNILIFHTLYEEWQNDTEAYANRGILFTDADDDGELMETSSLIPTIFQAETSYDNLGKQINFQYWTTYQSLGGPAQRKRLLKYFPIFGQVENNFAVNVDIDRDFENNPIHKVVQFTTTGTRWGEFDWGEANWGGQSRFKPVKLRFPGYAYYHQLRISRRAVNNPVLFWGIQYSYKTKRL